MADDSEEAGRSQQGRAQQGQLPGKKYCIGYGRAVLWIWNFYLDQELLFSGSGKNERADKFKF